MNDKRRHVDPERQKQVEQQIMLSYQTQPSQVKKKNFSTRGWEIFLRMETALTLRGYLVLNIKQWI